jgi:Holliday junction DNA helicase RuvA
MYSYIEGKLIETNPAFAIIEINGIGYQINISLNTYVKINKLASCRLLLHHVVREDAELLYGFADENERVLFRQLISVSGVGNNTACIILSSLSPKEIKQAIVNKDVATLKSIKGIGAKTAERIIVDLKDKLEKEGLFEEKIITTHNTKKQEALTGLTILGFNKSQAEKAINKIIQSAETESEELSLSVEEIIKKALKML